jgi:hypothetical protein
MISVLYLFTLLFTLSAAQLPLGIDLDLSGAFYTVSSLTLLLPITLNKPVNLKAGAKLTIGATGSVTFGLLATARLRCAAPRNLPVFADFFFFFLLLEAPALLENELDFRKRAAKHRSPIDFVARSPALFNVCCR